MALPTSDLSAPEAATDGFAELPFGVCRWELVTGELRWTGNFDLLWQGALPTTAEQWLAQLLPLDAERVQRSVAHRMPGASVHFEYRLRHSLDRWIGVQGVWLSDGGTKPNSLLLLHSDATARVQRERKVAQQLERLVRENADWEHFADVASHDLKEPLRTVSNYAQLLERSLAGRLTDKERNHLGFLTGGVHHMSRLLDGLLAFSRAGKDDSAPQWIDLAALVADCGEEIRKVPGATLEVGELPAVYSARAPLRQVFEQLFRNAIRFRTEGPLVVQVNSETNEAGEVVAVSVKDNGIGIDPQFHTRVFQPFQRLHSRSAGERGAGVGLGLAIVQRLGDRLGGSVGIESKLGAGSTFTLRLSSASVPAGM